MYKNVPDGSIRRHGAAGRQASRLRRGSPSPHGARSFPGVTGNPLSYSKDTLLLAVANKNPSATDWKANLPSPTGQGTGQPVPRSCPKEKTEARHTPEASVCRRGCKVRVRDRAAEPPEKPQTSTPAPNAATKTRSDTDTGKCPFLCGQENRHAHQPARRIVRHTASMPACRHAGIPAGTRTGRPGNRHAGNGTHRLTGMETTRRAQGPASLPPSGHASTDAGTPAGKTN